MNVEKFSELPLLGIVRGVPTDDIESLLEAVIEAGLKTIEITMNTLGAAESIAKAVKCSGGRITVGAGTVLSAGSLDEALDAGASFIVLPSCMEEVVRPCVEKKVPVFPGALTPHEVFNAWQQGAAMVKVFPSSVFGPKYMKILKGPFDRIKLMAVGGASLENISEYFSCGADAVAFGASVFKKEWLAEKDFDSIRDLVRQYVDAVKEAVSKATG